MEEENFQYHENGYDTILVSFGGMALLMGMSMFEFNSAIKNLPVDSLFLRDVKRIWYQNGISKEHDTVEKVSNFLKTIVNKYKKVIFIGNSSGGFASIMFGLKIGVHQVVAFSPQTCLKKDFGDDRWNEMMENLYKTYFEHLDLSDVFLQSDNSIKVEVCVPKFNPKDMIHANHIRNFKNVTVREFDTNEHNMAGYIKNNYDLTEFLKQYIDNGSLV